MLEIIVWSSIIIGGCAAYQMLGGKPAPKEEKCDYKKEKKEKKDNYRETYDYFMQLSLDEQHNYIKENYYLSEYSYELLYNTKESTARQVARRANYMGKTFNNRYSRY